MTKKKRRSKNRRNFVAIPFTENLPLLTLADATVLVKETVAAFGEDLFIISVDALFTLRDLTTGEIPITVGFSHGDLSPTEVAEALTAELTDPDDIIAKERARRPVRKVASFAGLASSLIINDGNKIRQKIIFSVGDGHTFDFFAFNRSGALLTTGAVLQLDGTIYGRWQR